MMKTILAITLLINLPILNMEPDFNPEVEVDLSSQEFLEKSLLILYNENHELRREFLEVREQLILYNLQYQNQQEIIKKLEEKIHRLEAFVSLPSSTSTTMTTLQFPMAPASNSINYLYTCDICKKFQTYRTEELSLHRSCCQPISYTCTRCKVGSFTDEELFKNHLLQCNLFLKQPVTPQDQSIDSRIILQLLPFKCEHCKERFFHHEEQLQRHRRTCLKKAPGCNEIQVPLLFTCKICNDSFDRHQALRSHESNMHPQSKKRLADGNLEQSPAKVQTPELISPEGESSHLTNPDISHTIATFLWSNVIHSNPAPDGL